jgi:hypothetical protein
VSGLSRIPEFNLLVSRNKSRSDSNVESMINLWLPSGTDKSRTICDCGKVGRRFCSLSSLCFHRPVILLTRNRCQTIPS